MAINDLVRKAKSYARQNPDKAKQFIDKIETTVDEKTQGKYRDKVTKAGDAVGGALGVERGGQQGQVSGDGQQAQGQGQPTSQGEAPEWKSPNEGTGPGEAQRQDGPKK